MFILRDLLQPLQSVFPHTTKGQECFTWFHFTLVAILIPLTSARRKIEADLKNGELAAERSSAGVLPL